jgi:hypothetical protein
MGLREGRSLAFVDGADPMAIIVWLEGSDEARALFAARDGFFRASTLRFCKRRIRTIQFLVGGLPLRLQIWPEFPERDRWFGLIGCTAENSEYGTKLFTLPANQVEFDRLDRLGDSTN